MSGNGDLAMTVPSSRPGPRRCSANDSCRRLNRRVHEAALGQRRRHQRDLRLGPVASPDCSARPASGRPAAGATPATMSWWPHPRIRHHDRDRLEHPEVTAEQLMQSIFLPMTGNIPCRRTPGPAAPDPATIDRSGQYLLDGGDTLAVTEDGEAVPSWRSAPRRWTRSSACRGDSRRRRSSARDRSLELLTGDDPIGRGRASALGGSVGGIRRRASGHGRRRRRAPDLRHDRRATRRSRAGTPSRPRRRRRAPRSRPTRLRSCSTGSAVTR